MKILEKLRKALGKNEPEKLVEGIAQTYTEKKENGEEHPIDSTVEEIMEKIMENPDPNRIREILKTFIESEKIPNRIVEKTAARISKNDQIPDEIITKAVEESQAEVPDDVINRIIEEGEIDVNERLKLMQNVEDKEIIEKRVENELEILYKVCRKKSDRDVAERINELKQLLDENSSNSKIKNLIHQVIAKKMAENYYSDIIKGTRVYELSQAMTAEEMMEEDLPNKVLAEYQKIEKEEGQKEGRFNKTDLKMLILTLIARNIVTQHKETGMFIIPQSNVMKNLEKSEKDKFIKTVQSLSEKELTQKEIMNIDEQIKGKNNNIQVKESVLISAIKKIPDKEKQQSIDLLTDILKDKETLKTITLLKETGSLEKLNLIPEEKRQKSIESIGEVLGKRKIATQTIKMEGNPQIDIYVGEEGEER